MVILTAKVNIMAFTTQSVRASFAKRAIAYVVTVGQDALEIKSIAIGVVVQKEDSIQSVALTR